MGALVLDLFRSERSIGELFAIGCTETQGCGRQDEDGSHDGRNELQRAFPDCVVALRVHG